MDAEAFTPIEKLAEIRREIGMRKRVYPAMIGKGDLTERLAQRRIAILLAISVDYEKEVRQMTLPL